MNRPSSVLISVVVPTVAGRGKYLASCLRTCVSQDVDNIEFIVSDNSDGDAREIVDSFADPRIRYVRPPSHLPMTAHWNFAFGHVSGDSICVIGDDDGLMPNSMSRLNEIFAECGNVPLHHSFCNYFWPDYAVEGVRNTVVFAHAESAERRSTSALGFLEALYAGNARYVDGPMIYHNFIPRKVVDKMLAKGPFFRSSTPDIYSAVAVAANVQDFLSVGQFLTISGQGAKSTGANVLYGKGGAKAFLSTYRGHAIFRSRFKSSALQMLVLEAIIEADKNFEMPLPFGDVNLARFIQMAVKQATTMRNRRDRYHEFIEILKASLQLGVTLKVSRQLVRWAVDRQFGQGSKRPMSWQGSLVMPPDVCNIYDASVALRAQLDHPERSKLAAA